MYSKEKHHIMLVFLSDVKFEWNKGGKLKAPTTYTIDGEKFETYTTNESAVCWLHKELEGAGVQRIFAFTSQLILDPISESLKGFNGDAFKRSLENGSGESHKPVLPEPYIEAYEKLNQFSFFRGRLEQTGVVEDVDRCLPELTFHNRNVAPSVDDDKDDHVVYVRKDETDALSIMSIVLKMAEKIKRYVAGLPKKKRRNVVLHADMTGGFRHAALMMMTVLRLMEYQKIHIGAVLYSDYEKKRVYNLQGIYNQLDATAGAEEFVNFGSVQGFRNYVEKQRECGFTEASPELDNLLDAMEELDCAIKLSASVDGFEQAVSKLSRACNDMESLLKRNEGKMAELPLPVQVISVMLERIRQEYNLLFENSNAKGDAAKKRVWISVRWCIQHGYIQQALALFVEKFLAEMERRNIIRISSNVPQPDDKRKKVTVERLLRDPKKLANEGRCYEPEQGCGRVECSLVKPEDPNRIQKLLKLANDNVFLVNPGAMDETEMLLELKGIMEEFYRLRDFRNSAAHGDMKSQGETYKAQMAKLKVDIRNIVKRVEELVAKVEKGKVKWIHVNAI